MSENRSFCEGLFSSSSPFTLGASLQGPNPRKGFNDPQTWSILSSIPVGWQKAQLCPQLTLPWLANTPSGKIAPNAGLVSPNFYLLSDGGPVLFTILLVHQYSRIFFRYFVQIHLVVLRGRAGPNCLAPYHWKQKCSHCFSQCEFNNDSRSSDIKRSIPLLW